MGELGIICQATAMPGGCLPLDLVPSLFLSFGMVLLLRKSSAQARIEGWDPRNRSDDDYAVVDDTIACPRSQSRCERCCPINDVRPGATARSRHGAGQVMLPKP
jgi:hypothetical protein